MRKKHVHIWLEFKGSTRNPMQFYSGKLQGDQLETTKPAAYFESLFSGSSLPLWRKSAMHLLQEALETHQLDWRGIRFIYCYYEEYPLPDLGPQRYETGDLFLGAIEYSIDPKLMFPFEMEYKKIRSIPALEAAFEGASIKPLDYCTTNSETLLHFVVEEDNVAFAKELIDYGFSVHRPTQLSKPIFMVKSLEMAQMLHAHGADIHERKPDSNVSLVYYAAQNGCLPLVQWYLAQGLEFSMVYGTGAGTFYPFSRATEAHIPCIAWWLDHGMDIHYVYPHSNQTLLQWAQKKGNQVLTDFLVSRGAER